MRAFEEHRPADAAPLFFRKKKRLIVPTSQAFDFLRWDNRGLLLNVYALAERRGERETKRVTVFAAFGDRSESLAMTDSTAPSNL
jgi:hypothetical protein